ncbi:SDE2 [Scenedesmus sp. PABB004]|nr:SDE2 [Scenedesmus sp. PABB004]
MQLLLRGLGGGTSALDLPPGASVAQLRAAVQAATGVPTHEQVLTAGGRLLADPGAPLAGALSSASGGVVHLSLRLAGGKGGFGALLRGQGRDGKATDNFDACRDLSGRRIRHVEAEKRLHAWQAEAKERELEKLAMKHMKEMARQSRRDRDDRINVEERKKTMLDMLDGGDSDDDGSSSSGSGSEDEA